MDITRIAPTPSGFLHLGNLVNFELTRKAATLLELEILLRIDDVDARRFREEYVEDIHRALAFLEITPMRIAPSQLTRTDIYWKAIQDLAHNGAPLFVCTCSRTQMPNRRCENNCTRTVKEFDATSGEDRIRLHMAYEDVTLWGREHPSYHLVSTVDDRDYGVTHVVRGEDLCPSTQIHEALNAYFGYQVRYAHHDLLLDHEGGKLSKSHGTNQLELNQELRETINLLAERLLPGVLKQLS